MFYRLLFITLIFHHLFIFIIRNDTLFIENLSGNSTQPGTNLDVVLIFPNTRIELPTNQTHTLLCLIQFTLVRFKTTTGNTRFHTYCRLFSLQLLYAQISRVSLAPNCRGLPC